MAVREEAENEAIGYMEDSLSPIGTIDKLSRKAQSGYL